jgi:LDH2 family malate/lactate/ureidoglycolate dehydrogenase
MTDRLDLAQAFENAGIERRAAEKLADEVFAAIRENVATRDDLRHGVDRLDAEIKQVELGLKVEIEKVRVEIREVEGRLIRWVVGTGIAAVLALTGIVAGLLKLVH